MHGDVRESLPLKLKIKELNDYPYVYSTDYFRDEEHFLERYPGDEWVDILGADAYDQVGRDDLPVKMSQMMSVLQKLGKEKNKLIAFTETGLEGIPEERWWTETLLPVVSGKGLSYVLLWRNAYGRETHFFGPWHGHSSENDFKTFISNDSILMLNDIAE